MHINMKSFLFSLLFWTVTMVSTAAPGLDSLDVHKDSLTYLGRDSVLQGGLYLESPQTSTSYDRRTHYYRKHWAALVPTQFVAQYAGNMGLMSLGLGWDYGRHRQWETHLLFGYIPRYHSTRAKVTMTVKENYIPWGKYLRHGWFFEPLECGLYVNTVFGHEFWGNQPQRYPDKYYAYFSTCARVNAFVGQRITYIIPYNKRKHVKSLTAFYEVSICDLYVRTKIQDKHVSWGDILCLSVGLKMQIF